MICTFSNLLYKLKVFRASSEILVALCNLFMRAISLEAVSPTREYEHSVSRVESRAKRKSGEQEVEKIKVIEEHF